MLYCDYPTNWAFGFQDPGSAWMYAIIELHDRIIFYLIIISVIVIYFSISVLYNKDHLPYLAHGNRIEIFWTITPAIVLWLIGLPSLKLLYIMDSLIYPEITVKAIASQWFWTYEYTDYDAPIVYDSFLIGDDSLELGDLRTLAVDNYLHLPINTNIRILVTSNDVIHSFAVPSLGIKIDAVPGRLNSTGVVINRTSVYYGGCSELCGAMHSMMPIGLKASSLDNYLIWLRSQQDAQD